MSELSDIDGRLNRQTCPITDEQIPAQSHTYKRAVAQHKTAQHSTANANVPRSPKLFRKAVARVLTYLNTLQVSPYPLFVVSIHICSIRTTPALTLVWLTHSTAHIHSLKPVKPANRVARNSTRQIPQAQLSTCNRNGHILAAANKHKQQATQAL